MVSWSPSFRAVGLATGMALVVTLAVMPGVEAVAAPVQEQDLLLGVDREAPVLVEPDFQVPATAFPEGEFDIAAPEAPPEPVKFGSDREGDAANITAEALEELPVVDRSEFSTTYDQGDGVFAEVISQEPVHILDAEGDYVDIETSASFNDGRWVVDPHPMSPSFADSAGDTDVVRFSMGGYEVGFTLMDARDASIESPWFPWFQGPRDEIRYPDVFDNVDLTYTVSGGSIKEILELSEAPAANANSWTWFVTANALRVEKDEYGDIVFLNRYDQVEFVIPAPIMWDSAGCPKFASPP